MHKILTRIVYLTLTLTIVCGIPIPAHADLYPMDNIVSEEVFSNAVTSGDELPLPTKNATDTKYLSAYCTNMSVNYCGIFNYGGATMRADGSSGIMFNNPENLRNEYIKEKEAKSKVYSLLNIAETDDIATRLDKATNYVTSLQVTTEENDSSLHDVLALNKTTCVSRALIFNLALKDTQTEKRYGVGYTNFGYHMWLEVKDENTGEWLVYDADKTVGTYGFMLKNQYIAQYEVNQVYQYTAL